MNELIIVSFEKAYQVSTLELSIKTEEPEDGNEDLKFS